MPIVEVFLGAFLQLLFDRLAPDQKLYDFARRFINDGGGIEKLQSTLSGIRAVIDDAEAKQINDKRVRKWLYELQHLAYDTEDVLEELEYEFLRFNLEVNYESMTNQLLNSIPSSFNMFLFNYNVSSKIKEITGKLEEIAEQRKSLNLIEGAVVARSAEVIRQRPPTSPLVSEPRVCGREEDSKKIMELLLSNAESGGGGDDEVFSVIPIVGLGGVGKTTFAQFLYNDEKVKEHFILKAWACVSDDFDVVRITKEIIGSAVDGLELSALHVRLQNMLSKKRYILVLDDYWSENRNDWLTVSAPFKVGKPGSKVIVTTRSQTVSSIVETVEACILKVLSNDDSWSLFEKHAFAKGMSEGHPNLELIGRKIVKKCRGLPLAVKTLGGLLRSTVDERDWEDVLNSKLWDLPDDRSDILPALRLS